MEAALHIVETPRYAGVERRRGPGADRRRGDRRSGPDRRAPRVRDEAGPAVATAFVGGRSGIRGAACRRCAFAHPRTEERGGVRLCALPDAPSGIVLGDQHACASFSPVTC